MEITKFMALIHMNFSKNISDKNQKSAFSEDVQKHLSKMLLDAEVVSLRIILDALIGKSK